MGKKDNVFSEDKYKDRAIRFIDKDDHYELIFTDDFNIPTSGTYDNERPETCITDVITDMRNANKSKELHIFVGSFGGAVVGLNMFLQQVLEFEYRVGINLGTACSCGFMLLASCNEIYTSPFSEWMYHEMTSLCWGKVSENKKRNEFTINWWNILKEIIAVKDLLTPEELKLGETSEVWLTGEDLIDRGIARPYSQYKFRHVLSPVSNEFYIINNEVYRKESDGSYSKYIKEKPCKKNNQNKYEYLELVRLSENNCKKPY